MEVCRRGGVGPFIFMLGNSTDVAVMNDLAITNQCLMSNPIACNQPYDTRVGFFEALSQLVVRCLLGLPTNGIN